MAEFNALTGATTFFESEVSTGFAFAAFGGALTAGGWPALYFDADVEIAVGGSGAIRFAAFGGDFGGAGGGWARYTLAGDGVAASLMPTTGFGAGDLAYGATAVPYYIRWGGGENNEFGFAAFGGDFGGAGGGWARLTYRTVGGTMLNPSENPLILQQIGGFMYATVGHYTAVAQDVFRASVTSNAQPIFVLGERLAVQNAQQSLLEAMNSITDELTLLDALGAIYKVLAQEGFDLALDSNESMSLVMQLIESLGLLGEPGSMLEATSLVTQALALRDTLEVLAKEQLTDQAAFSAAFSNALTARQQVIEAATLALTANGSVVVTLIAEESMALVATPTSVLEGLNTIHDGISFALTIRLGDTVYAAWVCNTETKAFSHYENYPFNSFFELDGRYYGVADSGVYLLEGNTDDGDAIAWRIRTGLWNLGTGKMKNVPSMYLGYRSSGDMVLKVVTTTIGGDKEQNWYQLKPVSTNNVTHEGRINLGRGLRSVYWGFELEGINGADFALETLQLFPVILDRRITGGSNGT